MRDKHGYRNFLGANLVFGIYDLTLTPSARSFGEHSCLIRSSSIEAMVCAFLPESAQRRKPDISPLYANLAGLPSALFSIGTWDPLLDDSLFMYSRWVAAGGTAQLAIYPGGVHGFTLLPCSLADVALARVDSYLSDAAAA
jgi:acetyl esterase/lipase